MKRVWSLFTLLSVVLLAACNQATPPDSSRPSTQDFGTAEGDGAFAVTAASADHIYVTGITSGELHGENSGTQDGFLRRYDSEGDLVWGRQIHSRFTEFANDVAASPGGANAYVVGATEGSLAGSRGSFDAFIRRYDETGTEVWTRQFGTSEGDFAFSGHTDASGNLYVTGGTYGNLAGTNKGENDVFVRKYRPNSTVVWTRQFGTRGGEFAGAVTLDGDGAVYVAGGTTGSMNGSTPNGQDAFIRKYNASGAVQWTRQIDLSESDSFVSLAGYSNGVYVLGTFSYRDQDLFVSKYNAAGRLIWRRFVGTPSLDEPGKVRIDSRGNVYVSGQTDGALVGSNQGDSDAFVRKYSSSGTTIWTRQFGTSGYDAAYGLATRGSDEVYVAGFSNPSLDGRPTAGDFDAYLRRLDSQGFHVWTDQ